MTAAIPALIRARTHWLFLLLIWAGIVAFGFILREFFVAHGWKL